MLIKSLIILIGILIVGFFESIFPKEKILFQSTFNRMKKNIFFWICNSLLSPLLILPVSLWATQKHLHSLFVFENAVIYFLFNLLILDVFLYWWHRLNHKISFLWRFHHVHHLDETLDLTTAVRFHFGEVILSACARFFFIIIFNISFMNLIIIEGIILLASIFHHSNINLFHRAEKILSYIIVTPSIHWVHHHAKQTNTDSNYSTIFSWWDRLFYTRSSMLRFIGMIIGVEGDKEQTLFTLIRRPFIKK